MAAPPQSSIENELRLATEEYRAGNLNAAESRVGRLLKAHAGHAGVQLARGIVQIARGNQTDGLASLEHCLEIQPDNAEALAWAAWTALNLRRFEVAEGFARRFTGVAPDNARAYYLLGSALRGLSRIEEALAAIDRSLELKPDDPDSLVTKARLLQAWQMPSLAIEFYRRAMAIRPNPAAGMELAKMLFRDSHHEAALDVLKQVSAVMPKQDRPYASMAEAYTLLHRFDEAEKHWTLAATQSVNPLTTAQGRARVEIAAGRFDVAETILLDLIEKGQDLSTTFSILATARRMKSDDLPIIEKMANLAAKEADPSRLIDLSYALGKSFDDIKDYERAIRHYDEANRVCLEIYGQRRAFDKEQSKAFTDFLIEISTPERIRALTPKGLDSNLPLFVTGMMRSGTTLTESILSAHTQVKGCGEQAFWTERVIEFIYPEGAGLRYDHDLVMRFAAEYLRLLDTKDAGIRYVVDKNPHNIELAAILHTAYPNSKIMHLKRHPVDNLLSIWMTPLSGFVRFASSRENLVFAYREHMRLVEHFKQVLPDDRFRSFRYEDLTSDPDATIRSMLNYLDLQPEEACFTPETNVRSVLTPSVYQVRQPIHRGSQERWKKYEPWLGAFGELLHEG